jgi:D-tagatose-1,6-bisphosphate aldolase subunit GatZ/KbaZ
VLKAVTEYSVKKDIPLLIEATSNQVDQYGGYTGMTPEIFRDFVFSIADKNGLGREKITLGGDHLGPNVWRNEAPEKAMEKAKRQISSYVEAGFNKIHLDASMPLRGDNCEKHKPLDAEIVASRTAELCSAAEKSFWKSGSRLEPPIYIIGTDVPVPGGAEEKLDNLRVTPVAEVEETIALTGKIFLQNGLADAWNRVAAVVVQPGVEFSGSEVLAYSREKAAELKRYIEEDKNLLYEAHSTDYQSESNLKKMVEDHFAILKVGPELTFAFREAVFALAFMEREWLGGRKSVELSRVVETVISAMEENPRYWQKYYDSEEDIRNFELRYSLSDRIRYYWPVEEVKEGINRLLKNLDNYPLPLPLISQFMPLQYRMIKEGILNNTPDELISSKINEVTEKYAGAVGLTARDNGGNSES